MANPQPDEFTKLSNELLEALAKIRIPGESRQCLDHIFRKTYGYQKIWDDISNSQFAEATGLKSSNVCRAINKLLKMNIVIKKDRTSIQKDNKIINLPSSYCIQKDYEKWEPLSKKIEGLSKRITAVIHPESAVIQNDNKSLSKRIDTKENKEISTKETIKEILSNKNSTAKKSVKKSKFLKQENDYSDFHLAKLYFVEQHKIKLGFDYVFQGGKDASALQNLVKLYSLDELKDRIDVFLEMEDSWLKNKKTLPMMNMKINEVNYALSKPEFYNKLSPNAQASIDNIRSYGEKKGLL